MAKNHPFSAPLNIFILAALLFLCSPVRGADDPLAGAMGARPIALGGAYVGLADDSSSIFTNPAGLAKINSLNFLSMYQTLSGAGFTGLLGAVFPNTWGGSLALSYRQRTLSNILVSQESADYTDRDVILSFAKKMRGNLSIGVNYRVLLKEISKDVPGFENENGYGDAFDLGIKYLPQPWLGIGLSIQSMGGNIIYEDKSEAEVMGKSTLGVSLKMGGEGGCFERIKQNMLLNLDLAKGANDPISHLHIGYEWRPRDFLALRLGIDQSPKSAAENYSHITAGFGIRRGGITFDYALRQQNDPSPATEHFFSLGYAEAPELD